MTNTPQNDQGESHPLLTDLEMTVRAALKEQKFYDAAASLLANEKILLDAPWTNGNFSKGGVTLSNIAIKRNDAPGFTVITKITDTASATKNSVGVGYLMEVEGSLPSDSTEKLKMSIAPTRPIRGDVPLTDDEIADPAVMEQFTADLKRNLERLRVVYAEEGIANVVKNGREQMMALMRKA